VVEAELALFEVQVEGVSGNALGLGEAMFSEGPEGFDAVDVAVAADELVIAMVDPEVFSIADIDQAMVPPPAIAMDDTLGGDTTPNDLLQRRLTRIGYNLRIDPAVAFEDTEDDGLATGSATTLASHTPGPKVGFVDFNLAGERTVALTFLSEPPANLEKDRVNGTNTDAGQFGGIRGRQVQGHTPYKTPESLLCNSGMEVIPVFPFHNRSLAPPSLCLAS